MSTQTNANVAKLVDQIRRLCITESEVSLPGGWKGNRRINLSRLMGDMASRRDLLNAIQNRLDGKFFSVIATGGPINFALGTTLGVAMGSTHVFGVLTPEQAKANPYTFDMTSGTGTNFPFLGSYPSQPTDVLVLDDVASSGQNIKRVIEGCNYLGMRVAAVMPIVDLSPNDGILNACKASGIQYLGLVTYGMLGIEAATPPPGYASTMPQQTDDSGKQQQQPDKQGQQQGRQAQATTSGANPGA